MKINKKLTIDMVDLDHILDIDIFENERNISPSKLFMEGLKNELEFNGIDEEVDIIEIKIRRK